MGGCSASKAPLLAPLLLASVAPLLGLSPADRDLLREAAPESPPVGRAGAHLSRAPVPRHHLVATRTSLMCLYPTRWATWP